MKKNVFIVFLIICTNCVGQKKDVTGTYFMTVGEKDNGTRCCKVTEVLKLNKDHTFSYYKNNDQGDYYVDAISFGRFNISGDSIFLLSQIPYPTQGIDCLPFNDSIGDNVFSIKFIDSRPFFVSEFVDNDYFAVDDSFKTTPVKVIKTIPDKRELLDTIDNRLRAKDYYQGHPLLKFQVYLEKPKYNNLLIVKKNMFQRMPGLTFTKQFLQTNNIVVNLERGTISNYFFDCSGYNFKIDNDDLKSLAPINNGSGIMTDEVRYKKLTAEEFDSLIIQEKKVIIFHNNALKALFIK